MTNQKAASRTGREAATDRAPRRGGRHRHRLVVSLAMLALVAAACGGAGTTTTTAVGGPTSSATPSVTQAPVATTPVATTPVTTTPVTSTPVTTAPTTSTPVTTTAAPVTTAPTTSTPVTTTPVTTTPVTTTAAPPTTTTTTTAAPPTTTTQAPAQTVRVDLTDFTISPGNVTIKVGDTVRWRNVEGVHTTTSGTGGGAYTKDGRWDSGVIAEGGTFSVTFTEAGQFAYFCEIHPVQMQATVTVED